MKLRDFKTFPHCGYHVDVGWTHLEDHLEHMAKYNLDLNPDFQRAHVWTPEQQSRYVEYILRGGQSGKELYFNCPGWAGRGALGTFVIVDGKQRLEAVRQFMRNKVPVFGRYLREFDDEPDILVARFSWNIAALKTRAEVLEWYLNFNAGGTVHSSEELARVQELLEKERANAKEAA